MEEGDDIFRDVDLDLAVFFDLEDSDRLDFLQELLRRHAAQSLAWVDTMEPLTFTEFLRSSVFASDEVYKELCWASAGVPRDFLELMSRATRAKIEHGRRKITFQDVRDVVQSTFEAERDIPPLSIAINQEVYEKVVSPNRSYAEFLLSNELAHRPEVSVIWEERLWHLSPNRFVDDAKGVTYQRYRIDYGMYVDLVKSKKMPDQPWYVAIRARTATVAAGVAAGTLGMRLLPAVGIPVLGTAVVGVGWQIGRMLARRRSQGDPVDPRKLIADPVIRPLIDSEPGSRQGQG